VARIVLLVTSPRLPAGLLSAAAWDLVRGTPVFAGAESAQTAALRSAGVDVTVTDRPLDALTAGGDRVWLAGPHGDVELARELGLRLIRTGGGIELVYGSWDPPGARLLDAVTVMDRLASPGGDPWKLQQTHQSLARFLLEEAYEAYDAILTEDYAALREELGDVLLQVVLHARLAQDWDVDDLAGDLVDKLIRRNPHVFADADVHDVDEITEQWERIKAAEKSRDSVLDGIAWAQPALALAAKVLSRARRAGLDVPLPDGDGLGETLLRAAAAGGEEAEGALRRAVLAYAERVRAAERAR
jgi:NTP pyrophosphatase (non-canonical NTP hydrolase)